MGDISYEVAWEENCTEGKSILVVEKFSKVHFWFEKMSMGLRVESKYTLENSFEDISAHSDI